MEGRVRTRARDDFYHHQGPHTEKLSDNDMRARTLERPSHIRALRKGKQSIAFLGSSRYAMYSLYAD